jgi:hypothetical protein
MLGAEGKKAMQRAITIEIDGHRHEVHHHELTGEQVRNLAHHEHGVLYHLKNDGERKFIFDEEIVELHNGERFEIVAAHEAITIVIEGTPYETRKHVMTGSEIKHLGHQPPANYLYRLDGTQRIRIEDDQRVHLHCDEQFITTPPCGHAS